MIRTLKYRLKDRRAARRLRDYAWKCNQIWNWLAAHHRDQMDRYRAGAPARKRPTAYDLEKLLTGTAVELGVHSCSINLICAQFVRSRDRQRHPLRFRASGGPRRALGWVPFKGRDTSTDGNAVVFRKETYRWFGNKRRPLPADVKTGAFVEDALGRWWVTFQVEVADKPTAGVGQVGIDLGLKTLAALSSGGKIDNIRPLRPWAQKLAVAQRAGNKRRAKAIYAKIANVRRDHLHKASTALVRDNSFIAVGDVSPTKLAKTKMAKSVLDAGWGEFRRMLQYKSQQAGAVFVEVNEAWTSRTCSACGAIPASSPKGMGALGIRAWSCDQCGAPHDRDTNAALNILRLGRSIAAREDDSRRAA